MYCVQYWTVQHRTAHPYFLVPGELRTPGNSAFPSTNPGLQPSGAGLGPGRGVRTYCTLLRAMLSHAELKVDFGGAGGVLLMLTVYGLCTDSQVPYSLSSPCRRRLGERCGRTSTPARDPALLARYAINKHRCMCRCGDVCPVQSSPVQIQHLAFCTFVTLLYYTRTVQYCTVRYIPTAPGHNAVLIRGLGGDDSPDYEPLTLCLCITSQSVSYSTVLCTHTYFVSHWLPIWISAFPRRYLP